MNAREVIQLLRADGWYELPGKPSGHRQFKHLEKQGKVTVSMHHGDIPLPTLKKIEKQSGMKIC